MSQSVLEVREQALVRCVYTSAVKAEMSLADVHTLLAVARKKNRELNVTGILLFENGSFFQVLEGTPEVVARLFEKIRRDERHQRVTKVISEPIDGRDFGNWTMGLANIEPGYLKEIDGFNDFFQQGRCLTELDEGRAKKLLHAFKSGRWRVASS
ncbi:MAG: BLUF domain-containing protein [Burkholderiaceae bacterium]